MGMDVYGTNPVIRRELANVEAREMLEKEWIDLPEDDLDKYFEAKRQHEEDNPGIYFRNNVWWWRPLWDYVWKLCEDDGVLTKEQYEEGHNNSGAEINVHQAELIALRLNHAIKMGWVDEHKKQYEADTKDDEHQYPFHEDNVKAFADFCHDSGGFSIQ